MRSIVYGVDTIYKHCLLGKISGKLTQFRDLSAKSFPGLQIFDPGVAAANPVSKFIIIVYLVKIRRELARAAKWL